MDEFETFDNYEKMHRLEEEAERLRRMVNEQEREMDRIRKQLTDMEAERFADRCERDMDLERWKDGIAAQVGHDLEDIADKITAAIGASRRGEDVTAALYDVHGDVVNVMADLLTMNPEDE